MWCLTATDAAGNGIIPQEFSSMEDAVSFAEGLREMGYVEISIKAV